MSGLAFLWGCLPRIGIEGRACKRALEGSTAYAFYDCCNSQFLRESRMRKESKLDGS
jgi:hypothetical protein